MSKNSNFQKGKKFCSLFLYLLIPLLTLSFSLFADDKTEEFWHPVKQGDMEKVKADLAAGIDVNAKNKYGATALLFTSDKGNVEMLKLLLEHGADVNAKDTFYGGTPVTFAAFNGHVDAVKLLLQKGASNPEEVLGVAIDSKNLDLLNAVLENAKLKPEQLNEALQAANETKEEKII